MTAVKYRKNPPIVTENQIAGMLPNSSIERYKI